MAASVGRLAETRAGIAAAYDRLFAEPHRRLIQRATVYLSIAGFGAHLALIFLARTLQAPPAWVAAVGPHYLAALYTPFSVVLFYEVLALIWSLPASTTQSIATQFEIVSLIVIRGAFKDLAHIQTLGTLRQPAPDAVAVFIDMTGGLGMFLLVTVFQRLNARRPRVEPERHGTRELEDFIARKKGVALLLALWLFGLAAYTALRWLAGLGGAAAADVRVLFYTDLFTVMIFTDVLVLLLSLLVSDRYELVFRNAAFVLSTILIRLSLSADRPVNVVVALAAMLFGIVTLAIFNLYGRALSS